MAYTTEVLVEQEMDATYDATSSPNSTMITTWIEEIESKIDLMTQSSFTTITTTDEYHDYTSTQGYIVVRNKPLIAVTTLHYNDRPLGETANWVALTTGHANDFLEYPAQSRIRFHSKNYTIPEGHQVIKATYTWGRASVPKTIQTLATLMVCERILDQKMKKIRKISPVDMSIGQIEIKHSFGAVKAQKDVYMREVKELYGAHGKLRVYLDQWNE